MHSYHNPADGNNVTAHSNYYLTDRDIVTAHSNHHLADTDTVTAHSNYHLTDRDIVTVHSNHHLTDTDTVTVHSNHHLAYRDPVTWSETYLFCSRLPNIQAYMQGMYGSASTVAHATTLRQRLLDQLAASPSYCTLALGQVVRALTLSRQASGKAVCCLLNVPAKCQCISGTDLLRQFYVLPHWDRSCRSNFLPHPVTVYKHRADQSQHRPYNYRLAPGRVATVVPIFKSMIWLDPKKSRHKRDSNPGSSAPEVDALTTRPARWLAGQPLEHNIEVTVLWHLARQWEH